MVEGEFSHIVNTMCATDPVYQEKEQKSMSLCTLSNAPTSDSQELLSPFTYTGNTDATELDWVVLQVMQAMFYALQRVINGTWSSRRKSYCLNLWQCNLS